MKNLILVSLLLFITAEAFALRLGDPTASNEHAFSLHLDDCGGIKVGDYGIMTAAHCVHSKVDRKEDIVLHSQYQEGSHLKIKDREGNLHDLIVKSVEFHPSYLEHVGDCLHVKECMDMALIQLDGDVENLDFSDIPNATFSEDEIEYDEAIEFTGSRSEKIGFDPRIFITGIFFVNDNKKRVSLEEQFLKSYQPDYYYVNDYEVAIYPESESFFSREAPILLKGDSGYPLLNSKGEVIGINSHSNIYNSRSVAKKINAKVTIPVLEWLNGFIEI
jgi:hypothetical protein